MRKRLRFNSTMVFLILLVLLGDSSLMGQNYELWGQLKPGSYEVGFRTIEKYDYSRAFRPKSDYFGNPLEGERARPIQVCLWYPAKTDAGAMRLTYGEYAFPYPEDMSFFDILSHVQNREVIYLNALAGDHGPVVSMMSAEMAAVRDAEPYDSIFPLIIYHQDLPRSYCENGILCEYLASHGFVVATTHSLGNTSLNPEDSYTDLAMLVRDKEFVISCLHDMPFIDHNRTGAIGHGHGGLAALNMHMTNSEIDAVVCAEGWFVRGDRLEFAKNNPFHDAGQIIAPMLVFYSESSGEHDFEILKSASYSDRCLIGFSPNPGLGFTHYPMFSLQIGEEEKATYAALRSAYEVFCRYTLNFLKAQLIGDKRATLFLDNAPEENGIQTEFIAVQRFAADEIPPTRIQFMNIAENYGVEKAAEIYYKFKALDPELILFDELPFNFMGYRLLGENRIDEAIVAFRLNADAYPNSVNTWDSLADALMAKGNTEEAIFFTRKALEQMDSDSTTDPTFKERVRQSCLQRLETLGE